jgi:hypothetical protein
MPWLRGHLYISRGALIFFLCSWLVFGGWIIHQNRVLSDQQNRDAVLAAQARAQQHATGCLVKVFLLNQPNLDVRVTTVLSQVFPKLPENCP